ncbi:MAG: universal stress protein [Methanopyri archaeon]|nr:universal stress protein [Methanopyri archaeon]
MAEPKILVPFDGSEVSERALRWALLDAAGHGIPIKVLYVVDERAVEAAAARGSAEAAREELRKKGERILDKVDEIAEELGCEDVKVEKKIREGVPWEEIVKEAEEDEDVNLIIMGSHGRTGITRVLLGSTAENVARHAPVSVLVVKKEDRTPWLFGD